MPLALGHWLGYPLALIQQRAMATLLPLVLAFWC